VIYIRVGLPKLAQIPREQMMLMIGPSAGYNAGENL